MLLCKFFLLSCCLLGRSQWLGKGHNYIVLPMLLLYEILLKVQTPMNTSTNKFKMDPGYNSFQEADRKGSTKVHFAN